jgi:hypothetical protein
MNMVISEGALIAHQEDCNEREAMSSFDEFLGDICGHGAK